MSLKDKRHWSAQSEIARDEVKDALEEIVDWLLIHRREAAWAAGGIVAATALLALFLYQRQARADNAWDKLSQAELYAYSGRPQEAQSLIAAVATERGSAAATTLARLLEGDLQYPRGQYDLALAAYDQAAREAPEPLRPYALADKIMTLEAVGKSADCAAAAQSFLDAEPDHLLSARVHVALARCQLASGQAEAAKASLQRISLQYPGTPWAEWAAVLLRSGAK